ncbi:hypothetical protein FE257_010967 [Aspergillus nanangensis]|uniref:Zn(2)-C6 fungal-type domain-containing protein n=1 Tax=Aspergillus nanangensis TaxID=2582783 RepID=A0AAD4CVU1_ASPNN|nr:hypothetical protein FE257_010967 [Aspergillus nanangensis]
MNEDRSCNPPNPLPKSVKVRSTCNACQQAKIRCSHEKPSCRRCQKQNIPCIYSMSRRLGRPAKKRDPQQDNNPQQSYRDDLGHHHHHLHSPTRKPRGPKKKPKITDGASTLEKPRGKGGGGGGGGQGEGSSDRMMLDPAAFDEAMVDELSTDAGVHGSSFLSAGKESPLPASDTFDLSTDSWLQDFMSGQAPEFSQDRTVLDALGISNSRSSGDSMFASASSSGLKDVSGFSRSTFPVTMFTTTTTHDQSSPTGGYYSTTTGNALHIASDPGVETGEGGGLSEATLSYTDYLKRDVLAFSQPLQTSMETFPSRPALAENNNPGAASARAGSEYDSTKSNTTALSQTFARQYQCQCHEQTVRELIKVNICACRIGSTVTIDSILSCQRLLQQLADTILQCGVCSKTGVNLLMVVVVSIDSLVSALETIISVENGLMEGLFSEFHDHHLHDYRQDLAAASSSSSNGRRYKGGGFHFKAQVESCPLLVGGFCVAADEKFSFVIQVLHSRLSGLLSTIRRIRLCARDILDIPASRGKLVMVMETDRRLQLIMWKMKMLARK